MTTARIEKADGWPFVQMDRVYVEQVPTWIEVTEEDWWYALEVLPPVYLAGAFQIGEPRSHDERGEPVRATYVQKGGRYFARYCTESTYPAARLELEAALARETLAKP